MLKFGFLFLQLAVVGICIWSVYSLTQEEESAIIELMKPMVMECIEECGIAAAEKKDDKIMDTCIKKCILKKLGVLNEEGKYDRDAVKQQISAFTDNEEEASKVQAALDECFKGKEDILKGAQNDSKLVDVIYQCFENYKEN